MIGWIGLFSTYILIQDASSNHIVSIVLNNGLYIGISVEILVFYSRRYDKYKILPDNILDRYELIYCHVADISADIRDENI